MSNNRFRILLDDKRYEDLYILSRYCYRVGYPILQDQYYDSLEETLKEHNRLQDYTSRTYDDDPIPFELLKEFDLLDIIPDVTQSESKYKGYLDEDKSLSIEPITTYEECFNFVHTKKEDIIVMLKVDGINIKKLYIDGNFELAMSRGRSGQGFDLTKNTSKIIPYNIGNQFKENIIYSEFYVDEAYLPILREKYGSDKYKTPKSSAISMLRVNHQNTDYSYLKSLTFNCSDLMGVNTKEEQLKCLSDMGFNTVPYKLLEYKNIPKNIEEFTKYIDEVCKEMYIDTEHIPSDGLVFEVNNLHYEDTITNQYSSKNIAFKASYWGFEQYRAIVEEIIVEQRRVEACCKVKIKPLRTKDNCQASVVNVYNPRILIDEGIVPGSEIVFERNSGAINSLVRTVNRR